MTDRIDPAHIPAVARRVMHDALAAGQTAHAADAAKILEEHQRREFAKETAQLLKATRQGQQDYAAGKASRMQA